jgi:serine/threonine protein kinase
MTVFIGSEVSRIRDLRTLYKDDDHLLCRGRYIIDEVEHSVLALMTSERPTPQVSEQLTHAYSLRDYIDASCAARPLALLSDQGRATLLMEDPGGTLLSDVVNGPMAIGHFLHLASGLAAALHKVHEKGIIHKDVKPANILGRGLTQAIE